MIINFQQGIVAYPTVGSQQAFLQRTGSFVSLVTSNGVVDVVFSHGTENYYFTEPSDAPNAWGPIEANTDYWLYWNLDARTAQRTFGITTLQPLYAASKPTSVNEGQHWFDTVNKKMFVYASGAFREVIRVFAAKVNNSQFTPLGSGFPQKPYAGSQTGINVPNVHAGRILADANGMPVRRTNGAFFTTESVFFLNGSPINTVRLESNVLTAVAAETLSKFQVVAFTNFGEISSATYSDLQNSVIALLLKDVTTGEVAEVCAQGVVTNSEWNWPSVGAALWVDSNGNLTETDPHVQFVLSYPRPKLPIARVLTSNSVLFAQQFETAAEAGGNHIVLATSTATGVVQLASDPIDPAIPLVVGDNDPRLTDARAPLNHTHPASAITITPTGTLSGTVQDGLMSLESDKLSKAGGTMVGVLVLNADPNNTLEAATKHYVDSSITTAISNIPAGTSDDKLPLLGGTMLGDLVLNADPTLPLGAATKQYVDNNAGGGTPIVDARNNVFVAAGALSGKDPLATSNVGIGLNTLASVASDNNVAIGDSCLQDITTGGLNVGIGVGAAVGLTTGTQNVFLGVSSGSHTYDIRDSVGIGNNAMVGSDAASALCASNVAIGTGAMPLGAGISSLNVAIGYNAMTTPRGASNNVAIGARTSQSINNASFSTALGANALQNGNYSNATGVGANSAVSGANQVQLGDSATTTYAYGAVQNRSDARDKADIVDTSLGLEFILKLTPRQFRWDYREDYVSYIDFPAPDGKGVVVEAVEQPKDGSKKRDRVHQGLIAQEVKAVMDEMNVDFGGFQDHSVNGGKDVLSIGYEELIAPLIKAVQQLEARVKELEAQLKP